MLVIVVCFVNKHNCLYITILNKLISYHISYIRLDLRSVITTDDELAILWRNIFVCEKVDKTIYEKAVIGLQRSSELLGIKLTGSSVSFWWRCVES